MNIYFSLIIGLMVGVVIKYIVNWLAIDGYKVKRTNFSLEILNCFSCAWSFYTLPTSEAIIFALMCCILSGISIIDLYTFKIPLILILTGLAVSLFGLYVGITSFKSAIWGIFVGAVIPLAIVGTLWLITKRQGMGFGDIQLGLLMGIWLGPMRMAITLFFASSLSLIVWVLTSFFKGFNKDRAMPMAPFLSLSSISVFIGSFYYPNIFNLFIL